MKPFVDAAHNHQLSISKPLSSSYEPTSVLDLRSSPASAAIPAGVVTDEQPSSFLPIDEWDSMLSDLREKDDYAPALTNFIPQLETLNPQNLLLLPTPFPPHDPFDPSDLNHSIHPNDLVFNPSVERSDLSQIPSSSASSFDRFQLEQLIQAAECVDSNDLTLAQVILARLNQQLLYPVGKPLQRAAFYFKEAIESLLLGGQQQQHNSKIASSHWETVQKIVAYKAFSDLSPIFQFANFTANQAILEAVDDRLRFVHVIDFDIGLGGQWPSFMQEIAMKCRGSGRVPAASLRITAIVAEESMETRLAGDILCSFARELGIRFQIDFVELAGFETLGLSSIRFVEGEAVVVNLSPWIFRQIGGAGTAGFFRLLRRISPRIAVFIDGECRRDGAGVPPFRRTFIDGLEFYSVLLESLDAAAEIGGAAEQVRRIERFLLRQRIFRWVEAAVNRMVPWSELLGGSGMEPVPLSEATESQAECLRRRVPLREFQVVKRHASLMLCWQRRELVATSAWRFS
ncbi:hypothetical protein MRB53_007501 [Persea americana]|uniref:Uncharacterized protein n=1 Tax=Persea americana TaxID=3435 RepID=A0ACC2MJQ8_PERAE|nr:hypothetical protein MRB53_007501 [Persea americana]